MEIIKRRKGRITLHVPNTQDTNSRKEFVSRSCSFKLVMSECSGLSFTSGIDLSSSEVIAISLEHS